MEAVKVTGFINEDGQLQLDQPLNLAQNSRVEVIVLVQDSASTENASSTSDLDTPDEEILSDLRQAWHEAITGQTIPVSELWDGLEDE